MHKNNFYISFGIWIAILPFLGIPGTWKNTLVTLSGLFLISVSLGPIILRKLQPKSKSKKKLNTIEPLNPQARAGNDELRFSAPETNQTEEAERQT